MSVQVEPAKVGQLEAIKTTHAKVRDQRVIVTERAEMLHNARQTLRELEQSVDELIDEDLELWKQPGKEP